MMDAWKDVLNGRCLWRFSASCSILDTCNYVKIGVKGAGGCMWRSSWMCGVMKSPALMLQLVVWLNHCFGVLVIFDCCFVMMEPLQL